MTGVGEELDTRHALRVPVPRVDDLLWEETLLLPGLVRRQVDVDVCGHVQVCSTKVVAEVLACKM